MMQHLDEHTIELYVAGSNRVADRKSEIEGHLAECPTCRDLADRMQRYYADFEQLLAGGDRTNVARSSAIVKSRHPLSPMYEKQAKAVHVEKRSGSVARVFEFARRHPIATFGGSGVLIGGLALLLNTVIPGRAYDQNPAYCVYSREQGLIEIRNAENRSLWAFSTKLSSKTDGNNEKVTFSRSIFTRDLNGDGINEVITILPLRTETNNHSLRVFDSRKRLLVEKTFSEPFQYLDRTYSPNIDIGSMIVEEFGNNCSPEIWITGNSRDRSPGVTIRMDAFGNVLGKYWHFGQLREIYCARVGADHRKQIILAGMDDAEDTTHNEFPAIVVLDPEKVIGETRSSRSPGFAFPLSDAEVLYVSIPQSDINLTLGNKAGTMILMDTTYSLMLFRVTTTVQRQDFDFFEFDYFFDSTMNIEEVKSNNHTDSVREELVKQGLLKGTINQAYRQDLKNRVRYWDGLEWQKRPIRVHQTHRLAVE
jgi:hypothetical protein